MNELEKPQNGRIAISSASEIFTFLKHGNIFRATIYRAVKRLWHKYV